MSFEAFGKGGSKSCDSGNQGPGCRPDEGPLRSGRERNSEGDSQRSALGETPRTWFRGSREKACHRQPCAMLLKCQATNQENPLGVWQGDEQLGQRHRAVSGMVGTWWGHGGPERGKGLANLA